MGFGNESTILIGEPLENLLTNITTKALALVNSEFGSNAVSLEDGAQSDEPVTLPVYQRDPASIYIFSGVLLTFSVVGFIGNLLVLIAIIKDPRLQIQNQMQNITVLNLAFTDIGNTALVCLPAAITVFLDVRELPRVVCQFGTSFTLGFIVTSLCTMGVISVDRFIAVRWPLHYPQIVTPEKLRDWCLICWMIGIFGGGGTSIMKFGAWVKYDYIAGVCDLDWLGRPDAFPWVFFCFTSMCCIPATFTLIASTGIVWMSREKGRAGKLQTEEGATVKETGATMNKKILKAMLVVVAAFFFLSFPIVIVRFSKSLFLTLEGQDFPPIFTTLGTLAQIAASVVNPLIYGIFRKDFRDAFAKMGKNLIGK